jgi:hypothetical protein
MRPRPYIGITGFVAQAEVRKVLAAYPDNARHRLMAGVLMSSLTLAGRDDPQPHRHPPREAVAGIFVTHPQALNLIHYHTASRGEALTAEMLAARRHAGSHCHGFQLNLRWPDPAALQAYRRSADNPRQPDVIVLQCGPGAMTETPSALQLAARVAGYRGLVDFVLIDPSAGQGKPFDATFAGACFGELGNTVPDMGFGVAGGLAADSVAQLRPLVAAHPDFSIDAEGRLRHAEDDLDVDAAIAYVNAATNLLR